MKMLIPIISIALCVAILEGGLRAHNLLFKEGRETPLIADEATDWRPRNGFQMLPKTIDPTKKTIFLVGDSYTQASDVKSGEAYYHLLSDRFNVFTIGAAGFGTYQEYLTIKTHIEKIKPDLVIIQFCSNDFINNSYKLTELDHHNRTNFDRRFYIDGKEVKHSELSFSRGLYEALNWSRLVGFTMAQFQRIQSGQNPTKIEAQIADQKLDQNLLKKEVGHTAQNLQKIAELVGPEKLRIFNVSKPGPLFEIYKKQTESLKIKRLDEAVQEVYKFEDIYAADGAHFNKKGHMVLGKSLKRLLLEKPMNKAF